MDNVYVIEKVDGHDHSIVGVFEAEGLAERARVDLDFEMSVYERDCGMFYRITAYKIGKIYEAWSK